MEHGEDEGEDSEPDGEGDGLLDHQVGDALEGVDADKAHPCGEPGGSQHGSESADAHPEDRVGSRSAQ